MKLTYPICCGVDVHKTFLVATIIKTDGLVPKYHKKRFSTFSRDLLAFKQWLLDNNCKDVCMESTGKYWIPVWNILEDAVHVVVANPKWVSAVKGNKDDTKDSRWIGDLFRMGLVPGSFVPNKKIRVLREFTVTSSSPCVPVKEIASRMLSLCAIRRWMPSCPICLVNPQRRFKITSWIRMS